MPKWSPPAPHPYVYDHQLLDLVNTEMDSYVGIDQVQELGKPLHLRGTTPHCETDLRAAVESTRAVRFAATSSLRLRCVSAIPIPPPDARRPARGFHFTRAGHEPTGSMPMEV